MRGSPRPLHDSARSQQMAWTSQLKHAARQPQRLPNGVTAHDPNHAHAFNKSIEHNVSSTVSSSPSCTG